MGLGLMQFSLLGCLDPNAGETATDGSTSSSSSGSSTTTTGDTVTGGIQTVTGDGPTPQQNLEQTCLTCDSPVSVKHCWCIGPVDVLFNPWGCVNDPVFEPDARWDCQQELGHEPSAEEFFCMEPVCPMPGDLPAQCEVCGDDTLLRYHCKKDSEPEERWGEYACIDTPDIVFKDKCALEIGVPIQNLTSSNFFTSLHVCPGSEPTTGGDPTTGTTGDTSTGGDTTTGGDSTTGAPLVDCDDWDPSAAIALVSGVRQVDLAFVTDLLVNPEPLLFCDDIRFVAQPWGFEMRASSSGQLFYELGLREYDIPLYLNGYSLTDVGDVLIALGELWYIEAETEFELVVLRNNRPVTLDYSVN